MLNDWPAMAVSTTGLLISAVGVIGANYVLFRFIARQRNLAQRTQAARVAAFQLAFRLLAFATIAAVGLSLLLLGLVLAGNVVAWAPVAPLAVIAMSIPTAAYARQQLRRLGK